MLRRAFLFSLTAVCASLKIQPIGGENRRSFEGAVDSIAEAALKEHSIPGLSVAVSRKHEMLLSKGYGLADVEQKIKAKPETIYQLGSISKQFTAAALMRLVERGKVALDDVITKHLPDYPTQGHTVLVRNLLHQTSGIKEFFTVPGFDELENGSPEKYSRSDLVTLFKKEPFQFAPGERWAYSNSNYTLLGLIIEKASGMTFEQYLQETLFQPLALSNTHSCGTRPTGGHFAKGYVLKDRITVAAPLVNMNTAIGDGGLCSSVLDLVKWNHALVGGRAVKQSSYKRMTSSETVRRGYKPEYGFGLSLVTLDGRQRLGHNGEITGFTGALAYYPDNELTVAVLTNRSQIWPEAIEKKIARTALGMPIPMLKDLQLRRDGLRPYIGTYDFGVFPLRVFDEGGRLKFDMKMGRLPYELLYQGNHTFVARSDPDAIRLTFSMSGGRAESLNLEMAAMRWYAERIP